MRHFSKHIDNNLERHPLWREKEWLHKSHSGAEAGKEIGRIAGAVSIWDVFSIFVFAFLAVQNSSIGDLVCLFDRTNNQSLHKPTE